jgi:capsular polysaccharide biosynthesis protein/Flp pilus assembly protein TadD
MEADMARALSLQREGRLDEAEAIYRRLLSLTPDNAQLLHHFGLVELERGRYPEAIDLIGRAIAAQDGDAAMHSNLGEACRRSGDLAGAFTHFKRAVEIAPNLPVAHINLGVLMRAQGLNRESEHFLLQAIMMFPDLPKAHMELGRLYTDEGRFPEAAECMKSVVALSPGNAAAHYLLGGALAACGDTLAAINAYELALQLGYPGAALELTRLRFEMGWETAAIRAYRELQPNGGRVLSVREGTLASWCARNGAEYLPMGELQFLPFDKRPPTLPASYAEAWPPGKAVVPYAFLGFVRDAEVLRPGFAIVAGQKDLVLEGLVTEHRQYAYADGPVRFNSDDGRMLLDLRKDVPERAGAAFVLGGGGDRYRWLYETLARLWFVEQHPKLRALPLVVASELSDEEREMLRLAYGGEPRLIEVEPGQSVRLAELAVASLPVLADAVSAVAIQFLRRKFSRTGLAPGAGRRIFLSRRNCASRRIVNEAELLPMFEAHGFEIIDAAGLGWRERTSLFEQAAAIVGIDDDAMADLYVAPLGAKVAVVVTDGLQNIRAWMVSAQLGHRFCYLQGRPRFDSHARHDQCDVELDLPVLQQFLATL